MVMMTFITYFDVSSDLGGIVDLSYVFGVGELLRMQFLLHQLLLGLVLVCMPIHTVTSVSRGWQVASNSLFARTESWNVLNRNKPESSEFATEAVVVVVIEEVVVGGGSSSSSRSSSSSSSSSSNSSSIGNDTTD